MKQQRKKLFMKTTILILGAAVALVGCKPKGGTSDQYTVDEGTSSRSITNMRSRTVSTNEILPSIPSQGAASSQGGTNTGAGTGATSTNEPTRPGNP
jgi:hypothetical protein